MSAPDAPGGAVEPLPVAMHAGQLRQAVPGGIGRYLRQLLGALPAAGVAVHPFAAGPVPVPAGLDTRTPGRAHDLGRPDDRWAHDLGRPHDGVRYELWHRTGRPRLPRTLRAAVRVVHAPSLAVPPTTQGRPLVVTVHDLAFLHAPESFTRRGVAFHTRALAVARRRAAMIVAPSHATRDDLVSHGFPGDRVVVAWHGAPEPTPESPPDEASDPREPRPAHAANAANAANAASGAGEIRKRLGLPERYVLAVGTVEPRKALDVTAAAVGALRGSGVDPGLELVIAGPDGWGDVGGLHHPWVHRLGAVDDTILGALYRGAAVLAQSSRWEGFGFPVIEAMAYDCPVVVADTSSLPELVAGGSGIVVPVGDVDALAEAIASIVTDEYERGRLVEAGRLRRQAFTWAASAAVHRSAYEAACEP